MGDDTQTGLIYVPPKTMTNPHTPSLGLIQCYCNMPDIMLQSVLFYLVGLLYLF